MVDAMGCDYAQGFFFSRPVVAGAVPWLLADPPEQRLEVAVTEKS
jgi:EAL domain-containing protein (putative c-di-GMP-specific phosphodiesterase class I)